MDAETFLQTLNEEILEPHEYSDTVKVSDALTQMREAISCLEQVDNELDLDRFFRCPQAYKLAELLLGVNLDWMLTQSQPSFWYEPPTQQADWVNKQLVQWRAWAHEESLSGIVVGLLLAEAQGSRGKRRRTKFTEIVRRRLLAKINSTNQFTLATTYKLSVGGDYRKFSFVIFEKGQPIIGVIDIYQTRAGGRQLDIFRDLVNIQEALLQNRVALLVVADGPGFKQMASVVERIAPKLTNLSNLYGLDKGEVDFALARGLSIRQGQFTVTGKTEESLYHVADLALSSGQPLTAELLGLPKAEATNFFLRYQASHQSYALTRNEDHLRPSAYEQIACVNTIFNEITSGQGYDRQAEVVNIISEHLGYSLREYQNENGCSVTGLTIPNLQLRFPIPLPLFFITTPHRIVSADHFEAIEDILSQGSAIARFALLFDPVSPDTSRMLSKDNTSHQKSQIVILDRRNIIEILLRRKKAAQKYLIQTILKDIDLSLVSPFVSEGPTPPNMFFGREQEIRLIVEQCNRQSFAIIGGRKVGKTSILQRLNTLLPSRMPVVYFDCQAHPDREDFLGYLDSLTERELRIKGKNKIAQAERILRAFLTSQFGNSRGALLLDEVDDLFLSDSESQQYSHILSRALRSISQSATATVIATGERSLFQLARDSSSPHWNFLSDLKIGPLSSDAARHLLKEPLETLGIEISPQALSLAVKRTGRHPSMLQYLGTKIVEELSPLSKLGKRLHVNEELLSSLTNSADFRNRFISTFWSRAYPVEKFIAVELNSKVPKSPEELYRILTKRGINVKASDILEGLSYLELYAIAKQVDAGYMFASEAFDSYFTQLASSLLIEQWREEMR